jgi:hypothetical protein
LPVIFHSSVVAEPEKAGGASILRIPHRRPETRGIPSVTNILR